MRAYIDKIEGSKVELRLGESESATVVLNLGDLPSGIAEGDVLRLTFERDEAATRKAVETNDTLREELLKRSQQEPF
jgi:hypothetical protein